MGIFDFFSNNIVINIQIEDFIKNAKNINWFKNCGKDYDKESYFDYILEENINKASNHLNQQINSKGYVTLERLLGEAESRLNWYLYDNYKKADKIRANGKLVNAINKRFAEDIKQIDFNKQAYVFSEMFSIKYLDYNWMEWIFYGVIFELYFLEYIPTIPVFYAKIFKVFQDGHIVTGWNGKFQPQHLCLRTSINREDSNLIIY